MEPRLANLMEPLGSPLRTSQGAPFTTISPRLFHRLSFFLDPEEIKSNKQTNTIKNTANGASRVYRGEYTWHQSVPLTELNLRMQAKDLERMLKVQRLGFLTLVSLESSPVSVCLISAGTHVFRCPTAPSTLLHVRWFQTCLSWISMVRDVSPIASLPFTT